jgi:tetratricopeptide (TPR) repeat protein
VRAVAQLVEAPGGRLLTSHTVQATLGDLFRMQDDIAGRVVEALSLPLTAETAAADRPQNPRAYELYLRANQLALSYDNLKEARDLYAQCLELDPMFAPAWARIGRCHRVIGKFLDPTPDSETRAQEAFDRAVALNPRLSIAHKFYAGLEADIGQAPRAMVRLLEQATRFGNDPELFSGLVHACRYCGLFDQSLSAHVEARRLDPHVPTSIEQTVLMAGDVERLLTIEPASFPTGDQGIRIIGLGLAGQRNRARDLLDSMTQGSRVPMFHTWKEYLAAWLDYRLDDMRDRHRSLSNLKVMDDPEAIFQLGWILCDVGDYEEGLDYLQRAVSRGYYVAATLSQSRAFDGIREQPAFRAVLAEADAGRRRALAAFRYAGGERLLGA